MLRVGCRVLPRLELTFRTGYLFAFGKDIAVPAGAHGANGYTNTVGIRDIPVWTGARYFFMAPDAGVYAGAEVGANMLTPFGSGPRPSLVSPQDPSTRVGFDVGVGYVLSRVPLHIGAQFTYFNIAPQEGGSEKALLGLTPNLGCQVSLCSRLQERESEPCSSRQRAASPTAPIQMLWRSPRVETISNTPAPPRASSFFTRVMVRRSVSPAVPW